MPDTAPTSPDARRPWGRILLIVALLATAAAGAWNYHAMRGWWEHRRAQRAFAEGDIEQASYYMSAALEDSPDNWEYRALSSYYRAISLISAGQGASGLELLDQCRDFLPPQDRKACQYWTRFGTAEQLIAEDRDDQAAEILQELQRDYPTDKQVQYLLFRARTNAAFAAGDYPLLLATATQYVQAHGDDGQAVGVLASALACMYAVTGRQEYRTQALDALAKAQMLYGQNLLGAAELSQRIRHRLATRQILTRREFLERFPYGWQEEPASAPSATQPHP